LRKLYRSLLDLRRNHSALADLGREHLQVLSFEDSHALYVGRRHDSQEVVQVLNFARNTNSFEAPIPPGTWRKIFDSAEACWLGPGGPPPGELSSGGSARLELNPRSLVMYERSSKLS
jgi:maltooligosyltrehalose trehalohydrolase